MISSIAQSPHESERNLKMKKPSPALNIATSEKTQLPQIKDKLSIRRLGRVPKEIKFAFNKQRGDSAPFTPSGSKIIESIDEKGQGKFDSYVYRPPETQFVQTKKSYKGVEIKDTDDERLLKFKFGPQYLDERKDVVEDYFEKHDIYGNPIDVNMRRYLEEIKKRNPNVGSKYKNATPKVSSIRSRADLEFLGITADDEEAPRRNRNAEALGMPPQPRREAKADELDDATSRRERKGIYWIKVQVDEEIRKNIVKAEEANDLWKKENTKAENRFKELHSDFQKRKQYVDREIEADTGEQLEKFEEYAKEMVEKLMKQNIVLKENNKSISKKGIQLEKVDDKLLEILIEQLEKSKVKRNFEKMTTLLGLT